MRRTRGTYRYAVLAALLAIAMWAMPGARGTETPHGQQHPEPGTKGHGAGVTPPPGEGHGHGVHGGESPVADARAEQGRELVTRLHCSACHLVTAGMEHAHGGGHEAIAPDLSHLGDRVRPEWLFEFLTAPHRLRPWLAARMPTFNLTDREALALTEHVVNDLRDRSLPELPERFRYPTQDPTPNIEAGTRLVSKDHLDCFKCHQLGDRTREGSPEDWAPDLAFAASRLAPEWIVRWLMDPQRIVPGTKMPSFFADEHSGPDDILEGDEPRQIIALRDYLLHLGPRTASPRYAEAKRRHPSVTSGEGWALMQRLNCAGCHAVGQMHARLEVAPPLAHAGSRVRREWLVAYLQRPATIRPIGYLAGAPARMPDFRLSREEAEAITAFLMSQEMAGLTRWWRGDPAPHVAQAGRALYRARQCASCHRGGDGAGRPIADLFEGPDLAHVGRRLQPDHLLLWLQGRSGARDAHPIVPTYGLSDDELTALVSHLMTLR